MVKLRYHRQFMKITIRHNLYVHTKLLYTTFEHTIYVSYIIHIDTDRMYMRSRRSRKLDNSKDRELKELGTQEVGRRRNRELGNSEGRELHESGDEEVGR